jgi:4-diphosphocytidyl-2-C-methyl-D-erythritol kinase
VLTPVLARGRFDWVVALADGGLSTPAVYAELDRLRESGPVTLAGDTSGTLAALRRGDAVALGRALSNDLQAPALSLRPGLRRLLAAGQELGAVGGVVSGSGPTVALLAHDPTHAAALAAALSAEGVCRTVRVAPGPAAGAHLVPEGST